MTMCRSILVASMLALAAPPALASGSGAPAARTGAPGENTCWNGCHNSFPLNSGSATLEIVPPANWRPGASYPITVRWLNSAQFRHGFEITSQGPTSAYVGTFAPVDNRTQALTAGRYETHTNTGSFANPPSWNMNWTAPATASSHVTFYAAGVDADNSGSNSGDYVRTTSIQVPIFPLTSAGVPRIGATVTLNLISPSDAGKAYYMASSASNTGFRLPDGRTFPLGPDALFFLTIQFGGLPPILNNYVGVLNPQGTAAATVVVPNDPAFAGLTIYSAYLIVDPASPSGIGTISNAEGLTFQP